MPRSPRADEAGSIYHALNRGNARNPIFFKREDYEAFERLIVEGLEKFEVDLIAYQWMWTAPIFCTKGYESTGWLNSARFS